MSDSRRHSKKAHGRVLLHETVAENLRRDIESGFYPRGTYLPSEATLCARFQVSRVTVRKALASLTDRGLTRPEAGIGHRVGGQLVAGHAEGSSLVAVLAPYAEGDPYFAELVGGLERTLAEAGLHLAVYSTDPQGELTSEQVMAAQVNRLLGLRPRATVMCGQRHPGDRIHLRRLLQVGIPVVEVGEADSGAPTDAVGTDGRLAGMMVTEWLWRWVRGPVALVVPARPTPEMEMRLEGYRLALESHGVPPEEAPRIALEATGEEGALAQRLMGLKEGERIGFFCPGEEELAALARAGGDLEEAMGRKAAVGYVASPPWLAVGASIPLVAARWAGGRMGESAGRLITRQKGEEHRPPRRVLLAPELVVDPAYGGNAARGPREDALAVLGI